ncbi:MAG: hypothetical protein NDI61_11805 [Bdellovibrionaceae bacterium]|nr:hypothetical protein [Pseudobdellovibrionaceae bacterium]
MKKLEPREKALVGITALVMVFALYQYGYRNFRAKRLAFDAQAATIQSQISTQTALLTQAHADRAPSSVGTTTMQLQNYIQENSEFTKLIEELTKNAESKDVSVLRLAASSTERIEGFVKTQYTLDLKAPYLSLGRLLEKLETSPLMIEIVSLNMSRTGTDLREVVLSMKLNNFVARQ